MGRALLATGRDMVYSCEWPFYQIISGILPDYKNVSKNCNLWRNYFDISYTSEGITNITNFEASIQDIAASVSGPGAWTDPDMAKNLDIWTRWETPELADGRRSLAVLVYNTKNLGGPVQTSITLQSLNLDSPLGYLVTDLIRNNAIVGKFYPEQSINVTVAPMDVFFFKATALSGLHDAVF
ncbi:hypothetical protein HPB51_011263 [Rhipicephalus microplus]|uniref:Alpha-galactosidase n=1 Tax=Rhipicephalus microplus TaxID=6941 RepID=A0A9J6DLR5_RHIMP|nr:hypothetical protein HPB51_011263 [Rhipicephalus microplus]